MQQFDHIVRDPLGLHAEPAVLLGKKIKEYEGTVVTICKDERSALANKLMALIGLEIKCGDKITVKVEGKDEAFAVSSLKEFMDEYL